MNTQKARRVLRSIQKIPHQHFVLHGSLRRSNTILPHRPNLETFKNTRRAKGIREKAVYATRVVAVAVLYATMPNYTQWRYDRKAKLIRIRHNEAELALYAGYIHVCRGTSFSRGTRIIASKRPAKVVRTFRITPEAFLYLWGRKEIALSS